MSLDISLMAKDLDGNEFEVFEANITHNMNKMADAVGLYKVMWRPEEISVSSARDATPLLLKGVRALIARKDELQHLNPANGWGTYDGLLNVATSYLNACRKHPSARIEVDR